jgi:ATP phosphoribosyltransferase
VETFPPENADLVLLPADSERELAANLLPVARILYSTAYLIANKSSWENMDLNALLNTLSPFVSATKRIPPAGQDVKPAPLKAPPITMPPESIRLALPDGHQQKHMINVLNKANIRVSDYPSHNENRRPEIALPGFSAKVIRPQDMPLQVANGKFDIAVTGKDWVKEHLYKFPSSPIIELADLKYGRVKIVAAVHNDLPASDVNELRKLAQQKDWKLRVASEYVNIADKYARDNHLGLYRIIPTWGATEAFLPDDADMLIENTETGGTLKRHNLKVIETLFESTACLIANNGSMNSTKAQKINTFAAMLRKAVEY